MTTTFVPRYRTIATDLRDRFERGIYPIGDPLPSQPRLAREFGVSLATLRQALEILRREGWIESSQGGVTRVVSPRVRRALVVEDDAAIREVLMLAAEEVGVLAIGAANADEAIRAAGEGEYAVVLLDVGLPGRDGVSVAAELRALQPRARLVFVTANPAQALHAAERGIRPVEILPKPFDVDEVVMLLSEPVAR